MLFLPSVQASAGSSVIQAFHVLIRMVRVNDVFADHALDVVNHSSQAAPPAGHLLTSAVLTRVAIIFATGVLLPLHWVHEQGRDGEPSLLDHLGSDLIVAACPHLLRHPLPPLSQSSPWCNGAENWKVVLDPSHISEPAHFLFLFLFSSFLLPPS